MYYGIFFCFYGSIPLIDPLHCAHIKLSCQMYVTECLNGLEFVYFYQQTFYLIVFFFYNPDSIDQMYVLFLLLLSDLNCNFDIT